MGHTILNYTRVRYKTFLVFFIINIITSIIGIVVNIKGPIPILVVQFINTLLSVFFIFIIRKIIEHDWLKRMVMSYYLLVVNLGMWFGVGSTHPLFIVYSIMLVQVLILTSNQEKRHTVIIGFTFIYLALGIIDINIRNLEFIPLTPLNYQRLISIVSIVLGNLFILHFNKNEIEHMNDNIVHTSYIDELTNAKNRRAFFEDIKNLEISYKKTDIDYMVIYLDIDNLKLINDTHGHPEGDRAITTIAHLIASQIRINDGFYRLGGDEFVLLFTDVNGTEILKKFDQIKGLLETDYDFEYRLDFSYGYAYRTEFESMESTMKSADDQMYMKKHEKKSVQEVHTV